MIPDVITVILQKRSDYMESASTVECDCYKSYSDLEKVTVSPSKYEVGDFKWVYVAGGRFKAFLLGICHSSCCGNQSCVD